MEIKVHIFIILYSISVGFVLARGVPVKNVPAGSPVILVPGDGGSEIEAKLDKPEVVHVFCNKKTDWFALWLNIELLTPFVIDCLVDNLRLVYNNQSRTTSNSPGVNIRIPGFGNTSTVEWLDSSHLVGTSYFAYIGDGLVKAGYTRDKDIKGAPYDFRKAPNEMQEFLADLKKLVEDTYTENNNQKVVIVGHSMGNPCILYMLNHQSQSWKDKYIQSYIALSGPWGGAVKPMRLMASGDNLGVFAVNPLTARPEQRSMPSTAWLMPSDKFWKPDEVLIQGPKYNYTVKDYERFFQDIDYMTGYDMWKDTKDLTYANTAPGVEVFCFHGHNVTTPAKLVYTAKQWYDSQPTVIGGDGDGTVNMRSLLGCLDWQGKNHGKPVHHQVFAGAQHLQILENKDVISAIVKIVTGKSSKSYRKPKKV